MRAPNILIFLLTGIVIISVSGCKMTVKKATRVRVDQNISKGNGGYLAGNKPLRYTKRPQTREVIRADIELLKKDEQRGQMIEEQTPEKVETAEIEEEVISGVQIYEPTYEEAEYETTIEETQIECIESEPVKEEVVTYGYYIVKKGESLWDISKKVYGKGSRWKEIYEANRDKIKNPNKLYKGLELRIP